MDEYWIGRETAEEQIGYDMREGEVNKYTLKIMADPKSLPYWEQTRFENLKRSEEAMKQIKRQIIKAKKNGTYKSRYEMEMAGESGDKVQFDASMFDVNQKIKEDKPLSDSEQEEIDEQLTDANTTKQLAEFKARALNDIVMAEKIKENLLSHDEILKYLDDESIVPQISLPLQTNGSDELADELSPR